MKVNISLFQINIIAGNPEKNFENILAYLYKLPEKDLHFVLLPELWSSGYSYSNINFCAKYTMDNIYKLLETAKEKKINIIGSVPWIDKNNLYNRSLFINSSGKIKAFYNKIHLFKPLEEDIFFTKGEDICIIKPSFIAGITLCYDLRFPELFRTLMLNGAEIIFISAQWPQSRIEHWRVLNIARAIENQVFIVSCNRIGSSLDIEFGGNSMIVAPNGKILVELDNNEKIYTCKIDTDEINKAKILFNAKKDIQIKTI
jgi:predicted amidohydrolase